MPEIAEVARVVHFLRLHLVGKTIGKVAAPDDGNIFGKAGTSGPAFAAALAGKTVAGVGRQGKYFWLLLSSPPHPVLHLGMTGWVEIRGLRTGYTRHLERTSKDGEEQWPPRFWKFHFEAEGGSSSDDSTAKSKVEVAFTDARRFGRVRLVDCAGADIRQHTPLVENGPDPVEDRAVFTEAYLRAQTRSRRVPVKALLLDQATVSGVGNWVADEVLYQARLHPARRCDGLTDAEVAALYAAVRAVCDTAVACLGDSDRFPEHWLFRHRWGKGKKGAATTLPTGEAITHVTVGGRTSCIVPSVQKMSGHATVDGVEGEDGDGEEEEGQDEGKSATPLDGTESRFFDGKKKTKRKMNGDAKTKAEMETQTDERASKKTRTAKSMVKQEEPDENMPKASRKSTKVKKEEKLTEPPSNLGRRRSSRLSRIPA